MMTGYGGHEANGGADVGGAVEGVREEIMKNS